MVEEVFGILVGIAGVYVLAGVLVAALFFTRWLGMFDPAAKDGSVGFRVLVAPGVIALWPWIVLKVFRTGKSGNGNGAEALRRNQSPTLEEKSLDGKSKLGQLVNARRAKDDLRVSLTVQNKTRSAKLSGTKVLHTGELGHQLKVLSRKNITRLVEDTPADRFKRIQDFVSIPGLEREETALNELILSEKKNLDSQSKLITQAHEILADLYSPSS